MDAGVVIGLVATTLSLVSLGWQVITWRASGARLHVGYVTGLPVGGSWEGVRLLGIEVKNSGRASTIVDGASSRLPDGKAFPLVQDFMGQVRFPRECRPGERFTAYYEHDALVAALTQQGYAPTTKLQPEVTCGHGVVRGKASTIHGGR